MSVTISSAIKQFHTKTYFFITTHTFEVDVVPFKRISFRLHTAGNVNSLMFKVCHKAHCPKLGSFVP
jgi:hypothetical protein